jgi:tetratricopeptide (TPR) repeat protein
LKLSREYKTRNFEAWNLQALGRIAGEAEPGQVDIAEEYIRMSIAIFDEMKAKPMCAQGHLFLGEVFQIAGRREEALENLRKAEEMYQETGVGPDSYWLTRIREALASLEPAS